MYLTTAVAGNLKPFVRTHLAHSPPSTPHTYAATNSRPAVRPHSPAVYLPARPGPRAFALLMGHLQPAHARLLPSLSLSTCSRGFRTVMPVLPYCATECGTISFLSAVQYRHKPTERACAIYKYATAKVGVEGVGVESLEIAFISFEKNKPSETWWRRLLCGRNETNYKNV